VPFIAEELFQKYGVPDPIVLKGLDLGKMLGSSIANNSQRAVEGNTYNIGLIMVLAVIAGIFVFRKFSGPFKGTYIMFVVTMILSTSLFPWEILQNTPIQVIQYPFRILMFTALFGSIVAAQTIQLLLPKLLDKHFVVVAALLTVITGGLWMSSIASAYPKSLLSKSDLIITKKMIETNKIPDSYVDQYVPTKGTVDLPSIIQHKLIVDGAPTIQTPVEIDHGNDFYLYQVKKGDKIDLPYVRYKYTKAMIDGKEINVENSSRGSVQVIAPNSAESVTVHLSYGNRPLFAVATGLSVLTWLLLGLTTFEKYRFHHSDKKVVS